MKTDNPHVQAAADLKALAAAAQGRSVLNPAFSPASNPANLQRESKIADLKARYESGALFVDERAIASKLVDSLMANRKPKDDTGE
jgi:anti-sigma28 factor (negative regulator of flagellin synthesis)